MTGDSTYNYTSSDESSEEFVIENGILRGVVSPYVTGHSSYGEFLLERLRAKPQFVGQVDGLTGREVLYSEMVEKSVKCAMWLSKQSVKTGDVVAICTHNQIDMYVPCFASLYLGAVFNPWWDTGITNELTRYFLNLTKPKVLFVNEATAIMALEVSAEIGMRTKIIVFGKLPGFRSLDDIIESESIRINGIFRCTKLSNIDEPAVIVYTSGTTGLPKGACHSNRSLFGNVPNATRMNKIDATVISIFFSPLAWSTGVLFMLRAAVVYETRIIYPEFTEENTLRLIEKYKINWLFLGTSSAVRLQRSLSIQKYDLNSLKYLWVGGGVFKEETQAGMAQSFPRANILQSYGTTELGGVCLQQDDKAKLGSCGRIVHNMSMKVIDTESGKILGPNEIGEACFKSPFMMTCYYDNPKATSETIDAEGWLHTGDLVHYDENGHVFVTDRIKDIIKYRGNHISPAMVEQLLQKHPEIIEAAVFGIPDDIDDEHPIAFVTKTTSPNAKVTREELENLVAKTLPNYMRLRGGVVFINEMPHTSSGKIARSALRKLAQNLSR